MKCHFFFFRKYGKMSLNLSSAAIVIGALRVNSHTNMHANYLSFGDE